MLSVKQFADLLGVSEGNVRVLLTRRNEHVERGTLRGERHDLLAGVIPEPAQRDGVRPLWNELDAYRYRAYKRGKRMAESAELALTDAITVGDDHVEEVLRSVLQYPADMVDSFALVAAFDAGRSASFAFNNAAGSEVSA